MTMPEVDKEQLEALRDRVERDYRRVEDEYRRAEENYRHAEENYRLDIAAIDHLQRRFSGAPIGVSASEYSPVNGFNTKPAATTQPLEPISAARTFSEYSPANGLNIKPPAMIQPPKPSQPVSAAKASEEWEIFRSAHK
jgi:hypothetical protein